MSFQKFVRRSTKGILLGIVILMSVTLVFWGNYGPSGEDPTLDEPAGIIFGDITITKREFNQYLDRAKVDHRLQTSRGFRQKVTPKPGELEKLAWESIVLLQDARGKGIAVTEKEKWSFISRIYELFGMATDEVALAKFAGDLFNVSAAAFEGWAADRVAVQKLIGLVMESHFSDYRGIYDRVMRENRLARAWVARFDAADYAPEVRPVRPDEVVGYFEANKEKYKAPAKIRVTCLLVGLDSLKAKAADPTEEEIRNHYKDNLAEFTETPEAPPSGGDEAADAPKGRQKALEEVRDAIVDKLKTIEARDRARDIATKINSDIGAACDPETSKYPETLFQDLRKRYAKEGVELSIAEPEAFHSGQVEEIEKQVGKKSGLEEWGFGGGHLVGDVSNMTWTSKGVAFFRMAEQMGIYNPGLTEPVRRRIVKHLESEQLDRRVQQAATRVIGDIDTLGFGEARQRNSVDWRPTRYFHTAAETGLEDSSLASQVKNRIGIMEPGEAQMIPGSVVATAGEEQPGAYVVYLEDTLDAKPEDLEKLFESQRQSMAYYARQMRAREYVDTLVKSAEIQDFVTKKEEEAAPEEKSGMPASD